MLLFMRRVAETTRVSVATDVINLTEENETHQQQEEKLAIPRGVEVYEIDGPFFFGIANKFDSVMKNMGDKPRVRVIRMRKVPLQGRGHTGGPLGRQRAGAPRAREVECRPDDRPREHLRRYPPGPRAGKPDSLTRRVDKHTDKQILKQLSTDLFFLKDKKVRRELSLFFIYS